MKHVTAEGLACFARCPRAYYELHVDGGAAAAAPATVAAGASAAADALAAAALRLLVPERPGPAPPQSTVRRRLGRDLARAGATAPERETTLAAFDAFCRSAQPFAPVMLGARDRHRTVSPPDAAARIAHRLPGLARDRDGWRVERPAASDDPVVAALEAVLDVWAADDALGADAGADDATIEHRGRDLARGVVARRRATRAQWRAERAAVATLLHDLLARRGRAAFAPRPSEACVACAVRPQCVEGRAFPAARPGAEAAGISSRDTAPGPCRPFRPDSSAG